MIRIGAKVMTFQVVPKPAKDVWFNNPFRSREVLMAYGFRTRVGLTAWVLAGSFGAGTVLAATGDEAERKKEALEEFDKDGDGKLSKQERREMILDKFDTDGDGKISRAEAAAIRKDLANRRKSYGSSSGHQGGPQNWPRAGRIPGQSDPSGGEFRRGSGSMPRGGMPARGQDGSWRRGPLGPWGGPPHGRFGRGMGSQRRAAFFENLRKFREESNRSQPSASGTDSNQ
ncbi:MAG: EF-hand domain-containing protein [Pirellulales bacterium]|nr:EF-hand domain-containing protein [Pirellulales bacterium]